MTVLTSVESLRVKFGGTAATGPVTLGQLNTLQWVTRGEAFFGIVEWYLDIPAGATLDDVAQALAVLLTRHESLRTTYPEGPEPVQQVIGSGELAIEVYALDEPAGEIDTLEVARELAARLRGQPFDISTDLPVRVALATSEGAPVAAAMTFSHVAADFIAMTVVGRQFTELAADPASRLAGGRTHQPLDQAAAERSDRLQRRADTAVRYWTERLASAPRCLYAAPYRAEHDEGPWTGWLRSPAAALAVPHITERTGGTRSMVVLAALLGLLSWRTGQPTCVFVSLASNRFEPKLRDYVGTLAQDTLLTVDAGTASFDELVRRTGNATLRSARHGFFDVYRLQEAVRAVCRQRGIAFERDCAVNNLLVAPVNDTPAVLRPVAQVPDALADTTLHWWKPPPGESLLRLDLVEVDGLFNFGLWTCDTGRIPRHEIEMLLRALEAVLVAAAAGDVDLGALGELTGVRPIERGPDWLRVDGSWIELSEVRRLLADALGTPAVAVFAAGDPAELVGYAPATDRIRTPEQAHEACLAALPGRYTAITPRRYVLCDGAPEEPADREQWLLRPVLAQGDGRQAPDAGR
jgi:hypothetical protein